MGEVSAEKAVWSTAEVNNLPDASFLYIAPGGKKDSDGKTTPRSLRKFPVKDASGKMDMPHLRNAIARIPQAEGLSDAQKKQLQAKARRMLMEMSSSKAISLSELSNRISETVRHASPAHQARMMEGREEYPEYWYVRDVYPGYCIVETRAGCLKAAYSLDADTGAISLAPREQWTLVKQEWVEVGAS